LALILACRLSSALRFTGSVYFRSTLFALGWVQGALEFGGLRALFVRDPDGTVIEFDERSDLAAKKPEEKPSAYAEHP
jgi:hypothetical protein